MQELHFEKEDRILILSPHPDDESIGCGGVLSRYGAQTDVILLTDGRYGGSGDPLKIAKTRANEFQKVMRAAKVHSYLQLKIADRDLKKSFSTFRNIDFSQYTHIFVPHGLENQRDHKQVLPFLLRCKIKKTALICLYEVWTPMQSPNFFINLQDCSTKTKLISFYKSQLKYNDYTDCAKGLNRYRGLVAHVPYAECFTVRTFAELKIAHCFWNKLFGICPKINGKTAYYFFGVHINKHQTTVHKD